MSLSLNCHLSPMKKEEEKLLCDMISLIGSTKVEFAGGLVAAQVGTHGHRGQVAA